MKFLLIAGLIVVQTLLRMWHIYPPSPSPKQIEVMKLNDDVMMMKGNHGDFIGGYMNGKRRM